MLSEAIKEIQEWQKENVWKEKPLSQENTKKESKMLGKMYRELICKLLIENIDSWEHGSCWHIKLNIKNYLITVERCGECNYFEICKFDNGRNDIIYSRKFYFWCNEAKIAKQAIKYIINRENVETLQKENDLLAKSFDELRGVI